jgi:NitT/TauT family transport system permease protein
MKAAVLRSAGAALPPLVFFLLVLAGWQAATSIWEIPVYLVPGPRQVWDVAWEHAGELGRAVPLTGAAAATGFLLSLVLGTLLGLVFAQSQVIQRSIYPYAIFLQTVPIVAVAPLLILWFGYGFQGVVAVSFILSLFPIITSATAGLTQVDPNLLELFEIHNASRTQVLLKLRLPNAVPHLVTGAKISCGLAVIGAIVGEIYAGFQGEHFGLGTLITRANGNLNTAYVFAGVICSTLLSIAIFATVSVLGTTILSRWHITQRRGSTLVES